MPKRILSGTVTSDKNDQTVTVLVERRYAHPVLKKTIRKSKKYRAHDPQNQFKTGDSVRIQECAPVLEDKTLGGGDGVSPPTIRFERNPGDQAKNAPQRSGETS
jgi:small subunit ribosomal protein S17